MSGFSKSESDFKVIDDFSAQSNLYTRPRVLQDAVLLDPSLSLLELQNITAKEESLLEGMVANFTRAPQERLLIFFKALLLQSGVSLDVLWVTLPHLISAECIDQAVNLNRVSIAKITSAWTK